MTSFPAHKEVAIRILRAFVQSGALPGDDLGPHFWPGKVQMPGEIADFPAAVNYAVQQGWAERSPGDQYPRLTDAGFAEGAIGAAR